MGSTDDPRRDAQGRLRDYVFLRPHLKAIYSLWQSCMVDASYSGNPHVSVSCAMAMYTHSVMYL